MFNYNKILAVMTILCIITSLFTLSVSAAPVDDNTDIGVVTESEPDLVTDDVIDDLITEDNTTASELEQLEQTNEYLKYICGILIVFLIGFLFWIVWKLLTWFF